MGLFSLSWFKSQKQKQLEELKLELEIVKTKSYISDYHSSLRQAFCFRCFLAEFSFSFLESIAPALASMLPILFSALTRVLWRALLLK
jgi:hypothetical protein